ncbi:UvrD-like helicase C-terminal domain-containing protein, partial [Brevibacterium aurantiacum]
MPLTDPFVADLRAVLTAAVDPMAGDEIMRLVSGRMLGLGAGDIAGLQAFTRRQAERRASERAEPAAEEVIAEAIDELIEVGRVLDQGARTAADRGLIADYQQSGLSSEALHRLVRLARALRATRSGTGTVASIIRTAMSETGIDSDIWGLSDSLRNLHRASVDAFLSAASQYSATDDKPSITGFLSWLSLMEAHDALSVAEPTTAADAINIMTVHASKGLEFDAVAVPSLVVKDFPTEPRDKEGWMDRSALPYPLRGDRAHLVDFDLREAEFETKKALDEWIGDFIRPRIADAHEGEERRLAY